MRNFFIYGIVVFSIFSWIGCQFWAGYRLSPLGFGVLPLGFFCCLVALLGTFIGIATLIIDLTRHKMPWLQAVGFVTLLSVAWLFSPWYISRSIFLHGVARRVFEITSPLEISAISEECLRLLPNGGNIPGPQKGISGYDNLWDAIKRHNLVHLEHDTVVILVRQSEVEFEWGGALTGHWGIRYSKLPQNNVVKADDHAYLQSSDHITFYVKEN